MIELPPLPARVAALTDPNGDTVIREEISAYRKFLEWFDPDFLDGEGGCSFTIDRHKALRFLNGGMAFQCWRMGSLLKPLRDDGKPNRPLTHYTVSFEPFNTEKEEPK